MKMYLTIKSVLKTYLKRFQFSNIWPLLLFGGIPGRQNGINMTKSGTSYPKIFETYVDILAA
jgi:hypothetical protein